MKASDLFGLVVRTVGLFIALKGLWILWWTMLAITGAFKSDPLTSDGAFNGYAMDGMAWLALGVLLLRGAPWIVSFSYPAIASEAESDEVDSSRPSA